MWSSSIKAAFVILLSTAVSLSAAQSHEFSAFLHESLIRESVIEKVMPSYPEEAINSGTSGIVRIKLAIGEDGRVLRIKVNPKVPRPLKEVTCVAVKEWRFKPFLDRTGSGSPVLGRLTFSFVISNGEGLVALYDPGPTAPDQERLGYYDMPKELREWKDWEECSK
jgi:TonB family protein